MFKFTVGNGVDYYSYVSNKIFLLAINTTLVHNTQFITCISPQCCSRLGQDLTKNIEELK